MDIREISQKNDLAVDTLRQWERRGMIPPVRRRENGVRSYTTYDEMWVYFVKQMLSANVSEDFLIEYATLAELGPDAQTARQTFLKAQLDATQLVCDKAKATAKQMDAMIGTRVNVQ